jgi:hypothetical protein
MSCSCTSAHAIPAGHADASIATRAAATAAGLDFLPLITEHFDVFLSRRDCYRTRLRAALNIIAELTFATRRLGCVESASRQVGTVRGRQENQIRLHGFVRDFSAWLRDDLNQQCGGLILNAFWEARVVARP